MQVKSKWRVPFCSNLFPGYRDVNEGTLVYNSLNHFGNLIARHLCIQKIIAYLQKAETKPEIVSAGMPN